nr:uncharacterized protein LOC111415987 [Onthophagus taurus]
MFEHSVKVPRLYKTAAKIAKEVVENNGSLKTLIYDQKHANIKALYALTLNCIKYAKQLDVALNKTEMLTKEPRLDAWLAKVLITELLWGKGRLPPGSKPVETILSYQSMLSDLTFALKEIDRNPVTVPKPRYVRVNTLLMSVNEAVDRFRDDGWILVNFMDTKNYDGFLDKVANLQPDQFMVDIHIKELLIFPPNTEFHNHKAYKDGLIFLQDKASCLAVHLLDPKPENTVLDLCAAPGMKTSYVACKMENKGTIYAVDVNSKRLDIIEELMNKSGINCVELMHKDLMTVNESCCPNVEYILVDPTCSGTGMTDRFDAPKIDEVDKSRIEQLFGFQVLALKRALRHFPHAKRVVYSTCSLISDENERVVREVIINCSVFKLVDLRTLMPYWKNFGSDEYGEIGKRCLYARPEDDRTNGFFVAVFERLKPGEINEFLERNQIKDEEVKEKTNTLKKDSLQKEKKTKKSSSNIDSVSNKSEVKRAEKKAKKKKTGTSTENEIESVQENSLTNGVTNNEEEKDLSSTTKKKKSKKRHSEDENSKLDDEKKKKKKSSKTVKSKKDSKERVETVKNEEDSKENDNKGGDEDNLGHQLREAVNNLFDGPQAYKLIENKMKKKKKLLSENKISVPIKENIEEETKEEVNESVKKEKKAKKTSQNQEISDDTKSIKKKKPKNDEIKNKNIESVDDDVKETLRRKKNLAKKSIDTFLMSHIALGTDSEEANSLKKDEDGSQKKHKRKKIENLQDETQNNVSEDSKIEDTSVSNIESDPLKEMKKKKRRSSAMEESNNESVNESSKKKVNDTSFSDNLLPVSKKDGSSKKKKSKTSKEEVGLVNDDKSEHEVKKGK